MCTACWINPCTIFCDFFFPCLVSSPCLWCLSVVAVLAALIFFFFLTLHRGAFCSPRVRCRCCCRLILAPPCLQLWMKETPPVSWWQDNSCGARRVLEVAPPPPLLHHSTLQRRLPSRCRDHSLISCFIQPSCALIRREMSLFTLVRRVVLLGMRHGRGKGWGPLRINGSSVGGCSARLHAQLGENFCHL